MAMKVDEMALQSALDDGDGDESVEMPEEPSMTAEDVVEQIRELLMQFDGGAQGGGEEEF